MSWTPGDHDHNTRSCDNCNHQVLPNEDTYKIHGFDGRVCFSCLDEFENAKIDLKATVGLSLADYLKEKGLSEQATRLIEAIVSEHEKRNAS